jgi:hypothetical protein
MYPPVSKRDSRIEFFFFRLSGKKVSYQCLHLCFFYAKAGFLIYSLCAVLRRDLRESQLSPNVQNHVYDRPSPHPAIYRGVQYDPC